MDQRPTISLATHRGLTLLVAAPTGVRYDVICAGHAGERRGLEGFLIPMDVGSAELRGFFARFGGWPPSGADAWSEADLRTLGGIVSLLGRPGGRLELDTDRLDELTEAWVPVRTAHGPGVLTMENAG